MHELGREELTFELPDGTQINSVSHEEGTSFLVDTSGPAGERAWLRCELTVSECQIAKRLEPNDVTPGS
jgi:hypothetical protein